MCLENEYTSRIQYFVMNDGTPKYKGDNYEN